MFFFRKKMEKNKNDINTEKNTLNQNIENYSLITSSYFCCNCLVVPEINNINYFANKISIKCPFHKDKELSLNEYLNNEANKICSICNNNSNKSIPLYYCYQCKKIICIQCKKEHLNEHKLISINEYNIKCQIHYNKKYMYYCFNCSSNLCDDCHLYHDNNHNILLLSSILLENKEIDFIKNKNIEYSNIIQHYKNYISLNNLILDTYKNIPNNFYYIKNLKNIIRFQRNLDIINNSANKMQMDLQKQNDILEKFNKEFETELKIDNKVVYLNWKNINKESFEDLCQIEFNQMKEFQSVGTNIEDISHFKKAKFPLLQELYLTDNNICDISVLENVDFELLKIIYLNKNKIKDISVFKKVKFLELNKLFLDSNNISDISVLENIPLTILDNINLSRNKIKDISVLKKINLKYLRILNIKKNEIDYSLKDNLDIIDDLRDKSIRIIY